MADPDDPHTQSGNPFAGDHLRSFPISRLREVRAIEAAIACLRSTMIVPPGTEAESSHQDRDSIAVYPLALTSKLSGVSPHALGVWERRYGFPVPERSASGESYFSKDQIVTVRCLVRLASQGGTMVQIIRDYRGGHLIF